MLKQRQIRMDSMPIKLTLFQRCLSAGKELRYFCGSSSFGLSVNDKVLFCVVIRWPYSLILIRMNVLIVAFSGYLHIYFFFSDIHVTKVIYF